MVLTETDIKNNEIFQSIIAGKRFIFLVGGEEVVGCGKSSLGTKIMVDRMVGKTAEDDLQACDALISERVKLGYKAKRPDDITHVCYCCDDVITANEMGFAPVTSHKLNFDELTLPDGKNDAQFIVPGCWIYIDELQNKVEAREWQNTEKGQLRLLNIRRKHDIHIVATAPLYSSVETRFRQMPDLIIEMHGVESTPGTFYDLAIIRWKGLVFKGYKAYERYLSSGDDSEGIWIYPSHEGDIFKCFDTNYGAHEFLYGINEKGVFYAQHAKPGGLTADEAYQMQREIFAKNEKKIEAKKNAKENAA